MHKSVAVLTLWLLCLSGLARAQEPGDTFIPRGVQGVRIVLSFDKPEFFLGESILLHYGIRNDGHGLIPITMGGDWNTCLGRYEGFQVTATEADGAAVQGVNNKHFLFMDGMLSKQLLEPGTTFTIDLPLSRYSRFEKAGTYTIRVTHHRKAAIVPTSGDEDLPAAQTKITLVMPSPEQARQVVDTMAKLSKESSGGKWQHFADFRGLRYPVYLPFLLERIQRNEPVAQGALAGLSKIATPEATQALIGLMDHKDPEIALGATWAVTRRLPIPMETIKYHVSDIERRDLIARAWRPEFAPEVLRWARQVLASGNHPRLAQAISILVSLGSKEDLPDLIKAMDLTFATASDTARHDEFLELVQVLLMRGAAAPQHPKSPGQAVVFLVGLEVRKDFWPEGWEATVLSLMKDKNPWIREMATPSPLSRIPRRR